MFLETLSVDDLCLMLVLAGLLAGIIGACVIRLVNPLPELPLETPTLTDAASETQW